MGKKSARLQGWNANLPNGAYFTRLFVSVTSIYFGGHLAKASHVKAAFSAFSCLHFPPFGSAASPQILFFWGARDRPRFPHFPRVGFESPTSKIRLTGFTMTDLR